MKSLSQAADLRLPLRLAFSVVLARAKWLCCKDCLGYNDW